MQGRYGVDAFARFTMGVALVAIIISIFFPGGNRIGALFDTIGLLVLLYTYYRMLSRDIQKRYAENEKYLAATAKFRQRFNREKNMMNQRKTQDRDHDDQWDRSKNTFENILCHTFFILLFAANIEIIYWIASLRYDYFSHDLPSDKGLYNSSQ